MIAEPAPRRRLMSTAILYVGEMATYLCDAGDLITANVVRNEPLTERILDVFYAVYLTTNQGRVADTERMGDDAAVLGTQHASAPWYQVACRLQQHLGGRDVVLVVPLNSASTYKEQLLIFLFHGGPLRVRSVVVLSDVMADTIACGVAEGIVMHCAPSSITIGHVKEGSTALYTVVKSATLRNLGIAEALSTKIASSADSADPGGAGRTEETETLAAEYLTSPRYREALIQLFGYRSYTKMYDTAAKAWRGGVKKATCNTNTSASGEEGGGRAWKSRYDHRTREAVGGVERLLARVTQRGPLPAIIAGEALHVPLLQCLIQAVVRRCSARTLRSAQAEVRSRKRDRPSVGAASRRLRSEGRQSSGAQQGTRCATCDDNVCTTDDDEATSNSTSLSSDDDDESWLTPQPLPQPTQPWLLPLLGGSIVGEFSHSDLRAMCITAQEATQTNGTVVHWKAVL